MGINSAIRLCGGGPALWNIGALHLTGPVQEAGHPDSTLASTPSTPKLHAFQPLNNRPKVDSNVPTSVLTIPTDLKAPAVRVLYCRGPGMVALPRPGDVCGDVREGGKQAHACGTSTASNWIDKRCWYRTATTIPR